MFHRHPQQNGLSGTQSDERQSIAQRILIVAKDLFQAPAAPSSARGSDFYAGLAIAPGVPDPNETSEFTGDLSRLQTALNGADAVDLRPPRVTAKMRNAARRMIPAGKDQTD